ncbi:MAG: hypothetical protein OEV40_16930 [Acidimicrobiia bacterium]|nr:hypothetical protein [Acidimicrobiia bacterium]
MNLVALWALIPVVLLVSVTSYLIVNSYLAARRFEREAERSERAFDLYSRLRAKRESIADELAMTAYLHASGLLDDSEFAEAKKKIIPQSSDPDRNLSNEGEVDNYDTANRRASEPNTHTAQAPGAKPTLACGRHLRVDRPAGRLF